MSNYQDLTENIRRFGEKLLDDQRRNSEALSFSLRAMARCPDPNIDMVKKLAAFGAQLLKENENETEAKRLWI